MNYTSNKIELPQGVELFHLSIKRESHGSYRIVYQMDINGEMYVGSERTHDSHLWDDWDESNPIWYANAAQYAFDLVFNLLS
jgi:hypothetical protein